MLILAHRGYHASAPENTLEAFRQAIAMKADGIETDVRLDSQGLPILFHDRLAPDGRPVGDLTQAQLSGLVGYPVPSLAEALQCSDRLLWNLEIKEPRAVGPAIKTVKPFLPSHRVLITSFWHDAIAEVSQQQGFDYGLLVAHRPLDSAPPLSWFPKSWRCRIIVWNYETADPELLRQITAEGVRSFIYGAVTRDEHSRAAQWSIEGIITDHPEYLRAS
jgi:glycerophosphoryl diester phosphodiesterase